MALLYSHSRFLDHDTGQHPERPERLRQVVRHLQRTGLDERCEKVAWTEISESRMALVHDPQYLAHLSQFAAQGGGRIEQDTLVSDASYEVARLAAGAACDAVERVVAGDHQQALCLSRPPGHHALRRGAMGFCLLNHVALAARVATAELEIDRVLIVDWDVHHGNGTQETFWKDEQVGFFSIHRWPFYPGTGAGDETGSGAGLGTIRNVPLEFGVSRESYLEHFAHELRHFADRIQPQLVLLSAGFDSHRDDPVGSLGLETEDFESLTRVVQEVAATHAAGRLVSVLEGGYNPGVLAGCVEVHLRTLLEPGDS